MCKTCVERIFKDGPNQCPYAMCHKTLRLRGFKSAFFSDLSVEREVDIRRRVAAVFNKVEDDFNTLDDYNEYLEYVENMTDNLVNGSDEAKRKADAEIVAWETQHKAEIERNRKLARESEDTRQKRRAAEEHSARQRRIQDMQADVDEKASAARMREEVLNSLQSAEIGHATEAMNKIMLKKRGQQKRDSALEALSAGGGSLSIRGLRDKKSVIVEDKPYDPYGGLRMAPDRVDLSEERLQDYHSEWLDITRTREDYVVGGYSPTEYLSRALFDAFSGLGVFIADDKMDKSVSTAAAAQVAGSMDVDDPF